MFETIQGEGVFTGVPAVFVRLQGCPVGCAWCDTKQTWETLDSDQTSFSQILLKTNDAPTWCQATAQEVVQRYQAQGYQAKHIVITGGEPCIYDLTELTQAFEAMGCRCQNLRSLCDREYLGDSVTQGRDEREVTDPGFSLATCQRN